jgi:hypothetical protein
MHTQLLTRRILYLGQVKKMVFFQFGRHTDQALMKSYQLIQIQVTAQMVIEKYGIQSGKPMSHQR